MGCPKLRWEHEHHVHVSRWPLVGFCLLGAPLLPWRAPLLPSRSPDLLSTSRYLASASSRLRKRCTLRFCERFSPSGHHRGRWHLSSSSGSESPLDGRLT